MHSLLGCFFALVLILVEFVASTVIRQKPVMMNTAAEDGHDVVVREGEEVKDEDEVAIVKCGTTRGPFSMKFYRMWSPHGYDRAVELFERGFYDHSHFFRVVEGFLVQFGISYSPDEELRGMADRTIPDDPQLDPPVKFRAGTISYAGSGDDSRNSHLFISYGDSDSLGTQKWETPVGKVVSGYEDVIQKLYSYGDMPPWG